MAALGSHLCHLHEWGSWLAGTNTGQQAPLPRCPPSPAAALSPGEDLRGPQAAVGGLEGRWPFPHSPAETPRPTEETGAPRGPHLQTCSVV